MAKMITSTVPAKGLAETLAYVAGYGGSGLAISAASSLAEAEAAEPGYMQPWWDFEEDEGPREMVVWRFPEKLRRELCAECDRVSIDTTDHLASRNCALARDWLKSSYIEPGVEPNALPEML